MKNNKIVIFLPDFLGPSVSSLAPSVLYFDQIAFDSPVFLQSEVYKHFDEIATAIWKGNSFVKNVFSIASQQYKIALETSQNTYERLKPLFDEKLFLQILTIHFILRGGRKILISETKGFHNILSSQIRNPSMFNVAVKEFVWHVHELYLELNGNIQKILKYIEIDAKKYKCPFEYLASFICHRIVALEGNPVHVLTNNELMIDMLAGLGRNIESDIIEDQSFTKEEILSFRLFDTILYPFVPSLDKSNSKKLIRLKFEKNDELNIFKQHIKEITVELLESYENKKYSKTIDAEKTISSLKNTIRDALEIDRNTLNKYFQALLEDRAVWIGIAGLISSLIKGTSPIIPASFGVTALTAAGTEALKAQRLRKEHLKANPTQFLYYLDRTLRK